MKTILRTASMALLGLIALFPFGPAAIAHAQPILANDVVTVQLSSGSYSAGEDAGEGTIDISLSTTAVNPVTVTVATAAGTATTGTDFMPVSTSIQFLPGDTQKSVSIEIIDDSLVENDETLTVTLSNPANATLGTPSSATVTIADNDGFRNTGLSLNGYSLAVSAWGDFDGDGDLDLIAGGNYLNKYYRNDGLGQFTEVQSGLPNWRLQVAVPGDYDNDGDLDLVLSGGTQSGSNNSAIAIYKNDGTGHFQASGVVFSLPKAADADWGDFDNDGDLDLLVIGSSGTIGSNVTKVYRNDGGDVFVDTGLTLEPIGCGAAAWGDYDGDGNLDMVLTGNRLIGSTLTGGITVVYHANGTGGFTKSATLTGMACGTAAWGDYDNDGDLDLLVNGATASYTPPPYATILYRNDHGTFVNTNAGLPDASGQSEWGDYDNDGDLDLLLTGIENSSPSSRVFRNDGGVFTDISTGLTGDMIGAASGWGDFDNDGDLDILLSGTTSDSLFQNKAALHNTPPAAPTGLQSSLSDTKVTLSWNASNDAQTPSQSLTYDLRLATYPGGGNNAMPPADLTTGYRRITTLSALGEGTTAVLRGLMPGRTYYWSVQAIDGCLAGSPFSAEGSFTTPAPRINFSNSTVALSENAGYASLPVTLSMEPYQQVTVAYTTSDLTATAGSDYSETKGTLTFSIGQKNGAISVPIIDDTLPGYEGNETFQVTLSNPNNAVLGSTTTEIVTIQDNEPKPKIQFDGSDTSIDENSEDAVVTVWLSAAAYVPVTVDYQLSSGSAVQGVDFQANSGKLTFNPGETSRAIQVTPINDQLDELDKIFHLDLSNPTNATLSQTSETLLLVDDDPQPEISIVPASLSVEEKDGSAVVTVSLSAPSSLTINVSFTTTGISATSGTDFTARSGMLIFNPGETSKQLVVTILPDGVVETDETFTVNLSSPGSATLGSSHSCQVTIIDSTTKPPVNPGSKVFLPFMQK